MEESVLLGTKSLVDSIRHFIRDPSGVFSVWHLCECRIVQWRHDSRLLLLRNWFLASRLFSLYIIKRTLRGGSKIWILCSSGKDNISPPCNILYIFKDTAIDQYFRHTVNILKRQQSSPSYTDKVFSHYEFVVQLVFAPRKKRHSSTI